MKLAALVIVLLFAFADCSPARELFECKSGQEFMQNDCNHCYCLKNNELVCRINKCQHAESKQAEQCVSGTVWSKGCNKCWCVISGTVCTNHEC
ncbi:therostasin-like [Photinus pyralis]|nr:therostasin-like [Photinus pyralis]